MSDTSPKNQDALLSGHRATPTARQPHPREKFCEFVRADRVRFCIELVDDGPYGIDVQTFRNEEVSSSVRFPNRAFALAYAAMERKLLERRSRDRSGE